MQSRVGQQFGNYRLVSLIGSGGYAEVYLAEHIHIKNLRYAIKVLTATNLQTSQQKDFLTEAQTVANLQQLSDHIVQISDFGIHSDTQGASDSDVPYLVMEYAAAGTLRRLYPHGTKVPLERITFYVKQIAEALYCAHTQNPPIVHLDIKPENLLLRTRDHVLLSDFGIAIASQTGVLTRTSTSIVGTTTYMAPERLRGFAQRASDQYSLGIVVYEWLCGEPPFDGVQQLVMRPPALFPTYPYVTQEIEAIVMRSLEITPEDRYPNVVAFAQALEQAVQMALHSSVITLISTSKAPPQHNISVQPQRVVPPVQLSQTQVAAPLNNRIGTTQLQLHGKQIQQSQIPTPLSPNATTTSQSFAKVRDFFELSPLFASTPRFSLFRGVGMILNVVSALLLGFVQHSWFVLLGGLLFSVLLFSLCIRAVEEKLALFFGILVALYWGVVGWGVSGFILASQNRENNVLSLLVGLLFFISSLGIHNWYVSNRNG